MAKRLVDPPYLKFPFQIGPQGGEKVNKSGHIRGQIEQVLFTVPGERIFRPEFGAGVRALIFEPNASALWRVTRQRLIASLAEALKGEVDPKSLDVDVSGEGELLKIEISYTLATIGIRESHAFQLTERGTINGG